MPRLAELLFLFAMSCSKVVISMIAYTDFSITLYTEDT